MCGVGYRSTINIQSREIEELSVYYICHIFFDSYRQGLLINEGKFVLNIDVFFALQLLIKTGIMKNDTI
jgi:hypothetical protein